MGRGLTSEWVRTASRLLLPLLLALLLPRCAAPRGPAPLHIPRVNAASPRFPVDEADLGFFMNYTGYKVTDPATGKGERFEKIHIDPKGRDMILQAQKVILMSVFLFDNLYADWEPPVDVAGTLTDLLVAQKHKHPDMTIAVVLDPVHRGYGRGISEAEKRFREVGIDVFYSDLIRGLGKGTFLGFREGVGHVSRAIDGVTFGLWTRANSALWSRVPFPVGAKIDGRRITIAMAFNAMLVKANHRKILVTDTPDGRLEALVASMNPHNASYGAVNTAVSVKGTPATYIYELTRQDIARCIRLGGAHTRWSRQADPAYRREYLERSLPARPVMPPRRPAAGPAVGVQVVTEKEIGHAVIRLLDAVEPDDGVRIQMFYLSHRPVLKAILQASRRTHKPIRLLLDANKDSFNRVKDGTPNRQVAAYLLEKAKQCGGRLAIRWYSTHGEQNHAKIMTITNPRTGKYQLTTGSCNWTARNMAAVNMESNLVVDGAGRLNHQFNQLFDLFWANADGNEYSLEYGVYRQHAGMWKWTLGDRPFYYSTW